MALKDWKKIGTNRWENKLEDEWEIQILNNAVHLLMPIDSPVHLSRWKQLRKFKTKSQALIYAKMYMRTH